MGYETIGLILLNYPIKDEAIVSPHPSEIVHLLVESSLVHRPHPLTRRNSLVNQVELLGLADAFATM